MSSLAPSPVLRATTRVVVRVRPLHDAELNRGEHLCAYPADQHTLRVLSHQKSTTGGAPNITESSFSFDHVFGADATQGLLAEKCDLQGMAEAALTGMGVTVLAYGITASGKTHTMSGPPATSNAIFEADPGVIAEEFERYLQSGGSLFSSSSSASTRTPRASSSHRFRVAFDQMGLQFRAAVYLFQRVGQLQEQLGVDSVTLRASYYEIYNDQVNDLLNGAEGRNLKVRMTPAGSFFVENMMLVTITSLEDLFAILAEGDSTRKRSASSHADSTRSHVIFSMGVETADGTTGKLNFCDLAGSERFDNVAKAAAAAASSQPHNILAPPSKLAVKHGAFDFDESRAAASTLETETKSINRSLFTLGKVISALAANGHHHGAVSLQHVPYRDSVLTKLLADSLNNGLVLMIACVAPGSSNLDESKNTLQYATMARSIASYRTTTIGGAAARIDAGGRNQETVQLRREVELLRRENLQLRQLLGRNTEEKAAVEELLDQLRKEYDEAVVMAGTMRSSSSGGGGGQQQHQNESPKLFGGVGSFSGGDQQQQQWALEARTSIVDMGEAPIAPEGGDPDVSAAGSDYIRGFDEGHQAALRTLQKQRQQQQQQEQEHSANPALSSSPLHGGGQLTSSSSSSSGLKTEVDELRKLVMDLTSRFAAKNEKQQLEDEAPPPRVSSASVRRGVPLSLGSLVDEQEQ